METVRTPKFVLVYEGKDISRDVSQFYTNITYTDNEHGKADEISVSLEDSQRLWQGPWYPTKGDLVTLAIGYEGEPLLPAGSFELDEFEFNGPPDVFQLKGLSASVKKSLRQKNDFAWEKTTLAKVAQAVAVKHGMGLLGEIKNIPLERITQNGETDLAFLKRLASRYRYAFKVVDDTIVFYDIKALDQMSPQVTVARAGVTRYTFRDKTKDEAAAAEVSYHDPEKDRLVTHRAKAAKSTRSDVLKIRSRVENPAQAALVAEAALETANRSQREGTLTFEGNTNFHAGLNLQLTGFDQFNGKWHIGVARHTVSRTSGYVTTVDIREVLA